MKFYQYLTARQDSIKVYIAFLFLVESIVRYVFEFNSVGLNKLILIYGLVLLFFLSIQKKINILISALLFYFLLISVNSLFYAGSSFTLALLFSDESGLFTYLFLSYIIFSYKSYLSINFLNYFILLFLITAFYLLIDKNVFIIFSTNNNGDYQVIGNFFVLLYFTYCLVQKGISTIYLLNSILFLLFAQFIGSNAATVIILAFFIFKMFDSFRLKKFFIISIFIVLFFIFLLLYFDLWKFLKIFNYGESLLSTSFSNRIDDYKNFYLLYSSSLFGNIISDVYHNMPGEYPHSFVLSSITHSGIIGFVYIMIFILIVLDKLNQVKNIIFFKLCFVFIIVYASFATFFLWPVLVFFICYATYIIINNYENNQPHKV